MQTPQSKSPKMLVVDDEESIRQALKAYFTSRGYEVDCAQELAEAQRLMEAVGYEVAIVDLRLTGIGGLEGLDVVGFLREQNPRAHIVLLTAHGTPAIEAEAKRRGADAFVTKPLRLQVVAQVVYWLTERKTEKELVKIF